MDTTPTRSASGRALLIALGFGALAGLVVGIACTALDVNGPGAEGGMWILLIPFVGAAMGLAAGAASWVLASMRPMAGYVVLVS